MEATSRREIAPALECCVSEGVRDVFPGVVLKGVSRRNRIALPRNPAPIEGTARRVTEAPALLVLSDELLATAEA